MELDVLDSTFNLIGVIDIFQSLIWTDRYYGAGDFELSALPNREFVTAIGSGSYLRSKDSEHVMIIDDIKIKSSPKKDNLIFITGLSLESILDRRIVLDQTVFDGYLQDIIQNLLETNIINPSNIDRKITNFEFIPSVDPEITGIMVAGQSAAGDSLYKIILDLCLACGVGFKITLSSLYKFQFSLYFGIDRSYEQILIPYVVFSPEFENLLSADYHASNRNLKSVALVLGESGVGNVRKIVTVPSASGAGSGLSRRELYVDAGSITRNTPDGLLTEEEYEDELIQKGNEELAKNIFLQSFEGQADITRTYFYGTDFFMGDIVQVANEYGHTGKSRIIEIIFSQDLSGLRIYPTFSTY